MDQTTAFNVASQSIDRLWAVPRAQTYNARDTAQVPTAPAHGIVANNVPYFNFAACDGSGFHFKVDNTLCKDQGCRRCVVRLRRRQRFI